MSARTPVPLHLVRDAGDPTGTSVVDELTTPGPSPVVQVPVDAVHAHPDNPRRAVGDVTELADSIRAHGIRQNLLVVPHPDHPGQYRVVIGHRRVAAANLAGAQTVPAVIDPTLSPTDQLQLMLLENLQRVDLTPIEEADGYQGLLDLGVDERTIAERTGRSRTTVRARLRLRALPDKAREAVHRHEITLDDAAAVGALPATVQADLTKTLGTANFASALARARQRAEHDAAAKPLLDALAAANATELDEDRYGAPDGSVTLGGIDPRIGDAESLAERTGELVAQLTAGCSWRRYYGSIVVYRPMTLDEAQAQAETDERVAAMDAEREAREAAAQQRNAVLQDLADVTAATRREHLTHLIHDRKALRPDQAAAVVEYAGDALAWSPWANRWIDGVYLRPALDVEAADLATWFAADVPTPPARDAGWSAHENHRDAMREPVAAAAGTLTPTQRLLAGLAAAVEPINRDRWRHGHADHGLVRWYQLLEALGYPVSDAERAALTPPPATDDDDDQMLVGATDDDVDEDGA